MLALVDAGVVRRVISAAGPADVRREPFWQFAGVELRLGTHPEWCHRCALESWLRLLGVLLDGDRAAAVDRSAELRAATSSGLHVCLDDEQILEHEWRRAAAVASGLDRHGWLLDRGLHRRSLARIAAVDPPAPTRPRAPGRPVIEVPDAALVFEAMGDAEEAVGRLAGRVERLLSELDEVDAAVAALRDRIQRRKAITLRHRERLNAQDAFAVRTRDSR